MTPQLLLESALRASLLGAGGWALLRLLKVRNSAHEWKLWLGILTVAVLMPFATPIFARVTPAVSNPLAETDAVREFVATARAVVETSESAAIWIRALVSALWPAYLGVAAILLARTAIGLIVICRIWRDATPAPALAIDGVQVRSSHRIDAPVVTGAGILVPADWICWSQHTRECVITHEASHLARNDFHWQLLARLHCAAFWVSPFAWWLLKRITQLAEHLSDDAAIAKSGRPADYAAVLLEFSGGRRSALLTVGIARRTNLSQRFERILSDSRLSDFRHTNARRFSGTVIAFSALTLAAFCVLSPWFRVGSGADLRAPVAGLAQLTSGPRVLSPAAVSPTHAAISGRHLRRTSQPAAHETHLQLTTPLQNATLAPPAGQLAALAPLSRGTGLATEHRLQLLSTLNTRETPGVARR